MKTIFIERSEVVPGVVCDVYSHPETSTQDLGIVTLEPGRKTPLQEVLQGDKTVEDYISGRGKLVITHRDGRVSTFEVSQDLEGFSYQVQIGECMQWHASNDSELQVFEVYFPPYQGGRFDNLTK